MIRALLILVAVGLGGCSTTQILYDNGPWLLRSEIDGFVDLDDTQADWVRARVDNLFDWHRRQELPRYAELTATLAADLGDGLDIGELNAFVAGLEQARRRLAQRVIPDLAALCASLDEAQIAHFDAAVRRRGKDDLELAGLPAAERQARRAEVWIERIERFYGRLTSAQHAFVHTAIATGPDYQPERQRLRRERHAAFVALLRRHPGTDAVAAYLHRIWDDLDVGLSPTQRAHRAASLDATQRLLVAADATMTAAQRARAVRTLQGYRDEFLALNGSP